MLSFIDLIIDRYSEALFNYRNQLFKQSEQFVEEIYEELRKTNNKNQEILEGF